MNNKELQKHLTEDLGCVFGLFRNDGIMTTCFSCTDMGEEDTLYLIAAQLLITSIKMPVFGRMLESVYVTLKQDRKEVEILVNKLNPLSEEIIVRHGNQD